MSWRGEYPASSWVSPDFYSVTDEERSKMIRYDILRIREERKKKKEKEDRKMSKLHYKVTVEFDSDASEPEKTTEKLDRLADIGDVTDVKAHKAHVEKLTPKA